MIRHRALCCVSLLAVLWAGLPAAATAPEAAEDCRIGSYRLQDGSVLDIAPTSDDALRWRRFDGTTGALRREATGEWRSTYGWTDRPDGKRVSFSGCRPGEIDFDGARGQRIAFDVKDTIFRSHDEIALAGRLVMPRGEQRVPIVVLLHGAERDSAVTYNFLQRLLPAEGVGVFVYDKRGTGGSGGRYSQDFSLLADDAVAAMREARRLVGARAGRVGYQGPSQGGWVAPIAANLAPVDFVIVSFGLAVSVLEEDQQQVEMEMRDKGYSRRVISQALEVARAAGNVIASGFMTGFEEFDAVRARYDQEPWYQDLRGNFTHFLLPHTEAELRAAAPKYDWGTPFRYDPRPTLRASTTPQLWILGERDYAAPAAETGRRLRSLMKDGRPFTLALYPQAEHGMTLFEVTADGQRHSTRYAAGYFRMMRDFARDGRLVGPYGDAKIAGAVLARQSSSRSTAASVPNTWSM